MEAEAYADKAAKDKALERSRVEQDLASQAALDRRSNLDLELKEEENQRTAALRRSRLQAQVEDDEGEKSAAERRARLEAELAA